MNKISMFFTIGLIIITTISCSGSKESALELGEKGGIGHVVVSDGIGYYFDGPELWRTDGTGQGTTIIENFPDTASMNFFLAHDDNQIYFQTYDFNRAVTEVWNFNISSSVIVKLSSIEYQQYVKVVRLNEDSKFCISNGNCVYISDGSAAGTTLVKEFEDLHITIYPTADGGFFVHNLILNKLWKSDGTEAGTVCLSQAINGNTAITVYGNNAYFVLSDTLWKTDGTDPGTVSLETTVTDRMIVVGEKILTRNNNNLLSIDPSTHTSTELKKFNELYTATTCSAPFPSWEYIDEGFLFYTVTNNRLYFFADDGVNGYSLWASDGSAAGTVLIKTLETVLNKPSPDYSIWTDGTTVYFTFESSGLWKTDGTTAGTTYCGQDHSTGFTTPVFTETINHVIEESDGNYGYNHEIHNDKGSSRGLLFAFNNTSTHLFRSGMASGSLCYYDDTSVSTKWINEGYGDPLWIDYYSVDVKCSSGNGNSTSVLKLLSYTPVHYYPLSDSCMLLLVNGYLWKSDGSKSGTQKLH